MTYAALQDKPSSTEIHWRDEPTVTDDETINVAIIVTKDPSPNSTHHRSSSGVTGLRFVATCVA